MTRENKVFAGPNIETASPALSLCAARNAVFHAVTAGSNDILLVVLYTPTKDPTPPCGCCRQVINEFCMDAHVYCVCDGVQVIHRRAETSGPDMIKRKGDGEEKEKLRKQRAVVAGDEG